LVPPNISGTAEDVQTSNFVYRLTLKDTKPKNEKLAKSGRSLGKATYFSNFGTPNIFGTAEDTNLKFCMQFDLEEY